MPNERVPARQRLWLLLATAGFVAVAAVLITGALVIADKPRFGWLVGSRFLQTIVIAIVSGAAAMAIGTWNAGGRSGWRRPMLLAWAAVAAASPVFGFLFLLPWSALALSAPAAVLALYGLWQESRGSV